MYVWNKVFHGRLGSQLGGKLKFKEGSALKLEESKGDYWTGGYRSGRFDESVVREVISLLWVSS